MISKAYLPPSHATVTSIDNNVKSISLCICIRKRVLSFPNTNYRKRMSYDTIVLAMLIKSYYLTLHSEIKHNDARF